MCPNVNIFLMWPFARIHELLTLVNTPTEACHLFLCTGALSELSYEVNPLASGTQIIRTKQKDNICL
jgi:hypothetical protein